MEYNYIPKYVKEHLNYQEGEIVKHGAYNRNFNILNIAVDNNTEALKHLLNSGGASVLDAKALDGAVLKRHRDHELQDNDEQIPSSKAVYEHIEGVRSGIQNSINTINNTLITQDNEMYKINKRIQVVNSLMEQYKDRADDVELMAQRLEQEFEFTHGTLHGGLTGQVLAKASDDELDYTWTELLPGPQGEQGVPGQDGRDGLDGADGTNGIDGAPGADGVGVPVGGTTGQVLKKRTNADHDTEWGEAASVLVKATGAEVITGTDDEKYVTPKAIKDGMLVRGDTLPIGTQVPFTSLTIPDNWLLCDGRAISRADYSELFAVIGTSYGAGNGTTTFNLPNKKGRTSVGHDTSQTEFNTVGKTGGSKTHTLSVNEMPSHTHTYNGFPQGNEVSWNDPFRKITYINQSSNPYPGQAGINYTGGGQAHNNLPPYQTAFVWKLISYSN